MPNVLLILSNAQHMPKEMVWTHKLGGTQLGPKRPRNSNELGTTTAKRRHFVLIFLLWFWLRHEDVLVFEKINKTSEMSLEMIDKKNCGKIKEGYWCLKKTEPVSTQYKERGEVTDYQSEKFFLIRIFSDISSSV